MECAFGALKSSLRPEMAAKSMTQQGILDEMWTVNGQSGVSADDFFVDDLFDFSNGFIEGGEEEEPEKPNGDKGPRIENEISNPRTTALFVKEEDFKSLPATSELSVPADDLAHLEWLSHFVEDSFSAYSSTYPAAGKLSVKPSGSQSEPEVAGEANPHFTYPVQTKARSKRARTGGGRVWSLGSPSLAESSTTSCSSSSSTTSASSLSNPWLVYASPSQTAESFLGKSPAKKPKKKRPASDSTLAGGTGGSQQPRRCSHCGVQKTPQWRAGPLGAKTLCNACGVRFKSGRLLPEYRPACSPTFSSDLHSNNHRKVLEMRRKKEQESDPAMPVQSFEEVRLS